MRVVITDLDGTLLDEDTFEWAAARPAVERLKVRAVETGCVLECFSEITEDQIARRFYLPPGHAALAKRREYDEPFTVLSGDTEALLRAIEKRGKKWSRGGSFYHITGQHDKALAVTTLLRFYCQVHREVVSIGLGDSPLDIEFLRAVDRAVIICSLHAGTVRQAVPNSVLTGLPGAAGWNRAILEMIP